MFKFMANVQPVMGLAAYFLAHVRRNALDGFSMGGIFIKALWCRVIFKEVVFVCQGQNAIIHNFIAQKNDFSLLLWAISTHCSMGNRVRLTIEMNRFNFCYLDEMVNCYLAHLKEPTLNIFQGDFDGSKTLYAQYCDLINCLNRRLLSLNIDVVIASKDVLLIKDVFDSMELRWRKTPGCTGSLSAMFEIFNDIKKQPHSFLTTIRYLSLFAEKTILGPRHVVLDIYHQCNADCLHCWIHSPSAKKELTKDFLAAKMDFDTVRGIIDDCTGMGVDTLTLLGDGEPILNPDFLKILQYVKNKNPFVDVFTFSNGLAVSPKVSHALVAAGLNEIWFSVPAASAQMYRKVCPSKKENDFEKIKKNIFYLTQFRNNVKGVSCSAGDFQKEGKWHRRLKDKSVSPYCGIAFVLHNVNYAEITDMARMAVELGVDEMRFQLIHLDRDNKWLQLNQDQVDFLNSKLDEVKGIAMKSGIVMSSALKFQLSHMHAPTGDWSRGYYLKNGCPIGFIFSIIKANGDVGLCCSLKVIDNLKNKSFKDIWFSQRYHDARVGAKHLQDNKDQKFKATAYHKDEARGDYLYSERCDLCDNHDMNNEVIHYLSDAKLYDLFMKQDGKP